MHFRHRLRDAAATCLAALPHFRGKGRVTRILDAALTDYSDPRSYMAVARLEGVRMEADLRVFGEKFAFYYREYESEYIALMRKLYRGGNFLDVGSNMGIYVVCMADAVRRAGARIVSIEPLAANVARQRANIELNQCADVVGLIEKAVGERPGTLLMGGNFESSSVNGIITPAGTVPVEVTTLDDLAKAGVLRQISMIKMDIEGYEPAVLRGAVEFLRRDRPVLFGEFNRERLAINGFDMRDSWSLLRSLGYDGHRLVNGGLQRIDDPGTHENLFFLPSRDSPVRAPASSI